MQELTEGTRLEGRYTLARRLGRGGMAETWLAHDARADARVALKFLLPELAGDARQRERFHAEWRLASRLMHAHIVRTFEYHDDADRPFFALQYIDGPALSELSGQPLEQALRPAGLLADALRYAHGKGIVHGDLTASNVLLDARGAPYLCDFGVARRAGEAGHGGGSPIAQSPQQAAGEAADSADDIYAFGVLLTELISGRPPENGMAPEHSADGEAVPAKLRDLVARMLSERRDVRPSAEDVRELLDAAGFPAGPATFDGKHRARPDDDGEVAVAAIRPRQRSASPDAPPPPAASGSRGIPMPFVLGGLAVLLLLFLGVLFLLPQTVDSPTEQRAGEDTAAAVEQPAAEETPEADTAEPAEAFAGDEAPAAFSENLPASGGAATRAAADEALGDLLSRLERLRYRGVERWGGQDFLDVLDRYKLGDEAYVAKNYASARDHYRAASNMLTPFFERINVVFRETMAAAREAFEARNHREAIRLYDLAVAITPGNPQAEKGLERARQMENVLRLMDRGREFEDNLEYERARQAYASVLELDPEWTAAGEALARVRAAIEQLTFEQRMTEGFDALAGGLYDSARAAFESAKSMRPESQQPVDGLLQVDQAVRLERIRTLESLAAEQEANEQWEAAVETYDEALAVDPDLQFAKEGLARARERAALHSQLQAYIDDPDSLSQPQTMQAATQLLLRLTRIDPAGPRLNDQKETLSRLLKRAATPLPVTLLSDNQTQVVMYRVGRLGAFEERQLELRPGTYVVTGSRQGFRDVRLEFRVAPEIEMKPIVVKCEERI